MNAQTPAAAHLALTEHRRYPYRGCAPDVDNPRLAAGDLSLSVDAWAAPDVDGGEDQKARRAREDAAIDVCMGCPVMVQCDTYASSVTADGRLAEPDGIWGGRRALERHRAFIRTRHQAVAAEVPEGRFRTPQKQAVLRALAAHTDPYAVAEAAGMDLRTANWQRSVLVTLLGLSKATATRRELLAEAARRGVLDGVTVVDDDGTVPAVPPPTPVASTAPRPRTSAAPAADPAPDPTQPTAAEDDDPGTHRPRVRAPRRGRFADIDGQLTLYALDEPAPERAPVRDLFTAAAPRTAAPLEAAAA
jgi:Transcription factor WhiB